MTTGFNHVTNGHPFFVAVFIPHICAHTQVYYIYWRKRKNVPWGNRQHNSLLLEYWLLSLRVLVHCSLCFYQKYATRIYLCVIAVSKSQEFWSKFVDFFFSTTTPTPSRRNFFNDDAKDSTSTTSSCFFDDVGHYPSLSFLLESSHSISRPEVVGGDRTWVLFILYYLYCLVKIYSGVLLYLV